MQSTTLPPQKWDPQKAETLDTLRAKWKTVPAAIERVTTSDLQSFSDEALVNYWQQQVENSSTGPAFDIRGWYHELYKPIFANKKVLDVGAGLGIDAFTFAQHGADITLLDIVPENVQNTARLARALNLQNNARSFLMQDISCLQELPTDFDIIWCQGSLINAPFDFVRAEIQALLEHLPIGGRWVELAYPQERWQREGALPFEQWGNKTDGQGTPWVEWYDLEKLTKALAPAKFDTILDFNFHNDDFNWFDLKRRS